MLVVETKSLGPRISALEDSEIAFKGELAFGVSSVAFVQVQLRGGQR